MSRREHLDEQIAADLYLAYRSSLDDTPYSATDQAVLQTAALGVTDRPSHARAYTALALLVAALGLLLSPTLPLSRVQPTGRNKAAQIRQANGDKDQIAPYGEYSAGDVLGPAYAQESQLEQATVAMQFTAESQYAVLAMQAAATRSDLHDVTLELLRIQPVLSSAR